MARLVRGDLDASEFESATAHVDGCQPCQSLAQQINVEVASHAPSLPDPMESESACQFAIQRLLNRGPTDHSQPSIVDRLGPYQILGELGAAGWVRFAWHSTIV